MDATVLICTFNRATLLAQALDSLAASQAGRRFTWEVLVVDNNSADGTSDVIGRRARGYPVPLRTIFEPRQGKSYALNSGIAAASGHIIVFTDDDVWTGAGWLEAAVRPLLERIDIDYTGGPVHPIWEIEPPAWIGGDPGRLWGPIALVDYGPDEFVFEDRNRIALGVNMAVRRSLIERVGAFNLEFERRGTSLMGQGQAEFFFRTRAVGARGLYVPGMALRHHVPAARMTHSYYRRWWYWKGVARARIQDLHRVSELGVDVGAAAQVAGIPRFMWGSALRSLAGWTRAVFRRDTVVRAEREMALAYFAGYARSRAALSRRSPAARESPQAPCRRGSSAGAAP